MFIELVLAVDGTLSRVVLPDLNRSRNPWKSFDAFYSFASLKTVTIKHG